MEENVDEIGAWLDAKLEMSAVNVWFENIRVCNFSASETHASLVGKDRNECQRLGGTSLILREHAGVRDKGGKCNVFFI